MREFCYVESFCNDRCWKYILVSNYSSLVPGFLLVVTPIRYLWTLLKIFSNLVTSKALLNKMQNFHTRDSGLSSSVSIASFVGRQSWGGSYVQQPPLSKSLSLNMHGLQQNCHNAKLLSFQVLDQDTSSTHSGQSYPEAICKTESNISEQSKFSAQSGILLFFLFSCVWWIWVSLELVSLLFIFIVLLYS